MGSKDDIDHSTSGEENYKIQFTSDKSKLQPLRFELIQSTIGTRDREAMLKYIMKDSYAQISIGSGSFFSKYRLRANIRETHSTSKSVGRALIREFNQYFHKRKITVCSSSIGSARTRSAAWPSFLA